ncbi:nuclease-related domain-containing protein [Metabacillus niabensis]|uniref:nuclease-related domain-containing protein n=1 Tax=Metabacillus niabensis TaxID=324854 RepID=UPI0021F5070D|nr:nuclease-related domain-containing protein [Metabacillus niabensis]
MILKEREITRIILQLEGLLFRLPHQHSKLSLITEEVNKRRAGFKGEKAIDYSLSFLDEKDYYIFHDLRLKTKKHFFQLDTLILTKK